MTNPQTFVAMLFSGSLSQPQVDAFAGNTNKLLRRSSTLILSVALICLTLFQTLAAQEIKGFDDPLNLKPGRAFLDEKPTAKVTASLTPKMIQPGDTVTLNFSVEIPQGSYIYSMDPSFGGRSKVKFEAEEGVEGATEFKADHKPLVEFSKDFNQEVEKFKTGKVVFSRKYKVRTGAKNIRVQGIFTYQICDDMDCRVLKSPFEEELTVSQSSGAIIDEQPQIVAAASSGAKNTEVANSGKNLADGADLFSFIHTPAHKHATTTVRLFPADAKRGDKVTLEVRVDLGPGFHTFTTTLPEDRAATPTELEIDVQTGLKPIGSDFKADRPHSVKAVESSSGETVEQEIYEHQVIWSRQFQLDPAESPANIDLKGSFYFQVCDDKKCLPATRVKFAFPNVLARNTKSVEPDVAVARNGNVQQIGQTPPELSKIDTPDVPANKDKAGSPTVAGVTDLSGQDCGAAGGEGEADIRDKGVIYVLGVAFIFGLLALLTPCVFPMVPITVSFFLKQAEKRHSSPLKMALVYSGSIILTFTVLGLVFSALFGATYINTLANGIWLNLFLGLVLAFFSLNLLGLFDIAIPSWLLTFTGNKESSGGYLGVFFMALTFTLTSFTCTFAFLGLILVWAANGQIWWPLAGLVSFSTAFALPFFLLALFPSYLHKLPKSGGWMNRVKVVMGFIELAFMFKFLSVADIGWNGGPTLLDYHMVMTAWMVLAAVAGLYLIGKIRLPHDIPTEHTGVFPMVLSMLFLGLAGYIGVGLFGAKPPEGFLGRQIAAFAPPQLEGGMGPDGPYMVGEHDKQRYLLDFEAAKQAAIRENKPLYIDFTGVNCINCRLMEKDVIAEGKIQDQLKNCIRVQLYCDVMPSKAVSDQGLADKLVAANQELQMALVKDASLPSYAVVSPNGKTIFSKKAGRVSLEAFNSFMTCGVKKFKAFKEQDVALTAAD